MNKARHDVWGAPIWYPEDTPYRVLPKYRSGQAGCFGWVCGKPQTFATEAEARAAADTVSRRGLLSLHIHKAENAATWSKNGRWRLVASLR